MRALLGLIVLVGVTIAAYYIFNGPYWNFDNGSSGSDTEEASNHTDTDDMDEDDMDADHMDDGHMDDGDMNEGEEEMASDDSATAPAANNDADDPYIWLEEVLGDDALDWVREHNESTLSDIKSDPRYDGYYAEALEVYTSQDRIVSGEPRDGFLYNFWKDDTHVRGLWRRSQLEDYLAGNPTWDVILDLDALAEEEGENWIWDGADCLHGSSRCMIGMSHGGSDANFIREFDMETRQFVEGGFYLDEAKQGTSWLNEDALLVTTDWGDDTKSSSGYPLNVGLWQRGTDIDDVATIFEGDAADTFAFVGASSTPEGQYNVVYRGLSFFEFEYHLVDQEGGLTPLLAPHLSDLVGFHKGQIIWGLNEDWSVETVSGEQSFAIGTVISYSVEDLLDDGTLNSVHVLFEPQNRVAFEGGTISGGALYLTLLDNVVGRVVRATFDGDWSMEDVALPANGTVGIAATDDFSDKVFFTYENFLTPDSLYYAADGSTPNQVQSLPEWFDAEGLVVSQQIAVSSDGESIPYFLIHGDGIEYDGSTPTLVYGYGGFQISELPFYSGNVGRLWLAQGGAYALTNIRGGGEFGPAWHQAALLENRQLAFDDFIAIQEHLIETGVTSPRRMGIMGGSNGGLLVGASMTQRPDLINAVVCQVPLLDMLRYHHLLAGASWIGEYGDPDIPEQREYIAEYSPYQNLDPDADYPTAFFYTSTRDDRVHPAHARKMVARMIEQGHDVQYFERIEGGHSGGANLAQSAERVALEYVYLARQLMD